MAEILSQNEIDSLLAALSTGDPGESGNVQDTGKGVKIYDFKHPDRFSKDQTRSLQMLHEHFARLFSTSLSTYLRTICEVKLVSVDQLSYDEFIRSIPNPTCINLFEMHPLNGTAVLEISPSLAFSVVDRLMGGRGQTFQRNRELTEIEVSIVLKIISRIFDELKDAWGDVIELSMDLKATEMNPQLFLQLFLPTEMVILMTLEVNLGESSGTFCICIPYVVLEPVAGRLSARSWVSGRRAGSEVESKAAMENHLRKFHLELRAFLGSTDLKVQEILDLELGDVLQLTQRKDEEIDILLADNVMFKGRPGTHRKHRAFKVTQVIAKEMEWGQ